MFVRAANPIWYMVDHIGQPLNDEYYAFFLTNTLPYLPQNVYRDPQGMTVWTGDIVQFSPAGTLPDNLYFDPNLVYRIEIRHGNTQADALIWEINNFVPGGGGGNDNNTLSILSNENQITNPQFSLISFVSPFTITTAGTYNIAPGWDLILTGTGSITISQNILSGNQNIVNNPPFSLRVNNNGWTESYLRQRFNHNGAIWANGAVTMSITARAQTSPQEISLIYAPSSPGVSQVVATGILGTGDYEVLDGAIDLPASVNTGLSTVAYVDTIIQLPPTGIVDLSNVQVIGQADPLPSDFNPDTDIPHYQQETEERYIDHTFNVYAEQLIQMPKKNILVGWTFALNPWQFVTTAATTVAAQTQYIADQTILHQETASALTSGRAGATGNYGLQLTARNAVSANRFAIIQYIDPASIAPYWGQILSSLNRARIFTSHGTAVKLKCRLIYRTTLPPTISNTEPITGWDVNGDVTFAVGWTAIEPLNDVDYTLLNAYDTTEGATAFPKFPFDHMALPQSPGATLPSTATVGLVFYTTSNLNNSSGSEDSIVFDRISLVPNKFAVDASPETWDESIRRCEFYYEKSYAVGVLPGSITDLQAQIVRLNKPYDGASSRMYFGTFTARFKQTKRAAPIISIISNISGNAGEIVGEIVRNAGNPAPEAGTNPQDYVLGLNYLVGGIGTDSWTMSATATSTQRMRIVVGDVGDEALAVYHYTADARLGV